MNDESANERDEQTAVAEGELKTIYGEIPAEERKGIDVLLGWWGKHYRKTGHRRLARVFLKLKP